MRNLLVFAFIIFGSMSLYAQDDATEEATEETEEEQNYWTKSASLGLNVTNVGFSTYWAGGGNPSLSVTGLVKANATYNKGAVTWLNTFEGGYGLVRQVDDYNNVLLRKSDDRIVAVSKWSKAFGESSWAFTALGDFRTQFTDGFTYTYVNEEPEATRISDLLAPGYLTLAAGGEYKPNDNLYIMASPVSGKVTFVMDEDLSNQSAFGVDSGSTIRTELGAIFNARYATSLMENISFETKINLFQAYREGAMIDVMWDNLLEFKINDYFTSTFSTQLIYDEDVLFENPDSGEMEPHVQFKHVLNIGFLLRF